MKHLAGLEQRQRETCRRADSSPDRLNHHVHIGELKLDGAVRAGTFDRLGP
jgi:hypothetical protein